MDEPCSALDPLATLAIEDLIAELKNRYTIVIVTHNMQQAARASDVTAFFNLEATGKPGHLVEVGATNADLHQPDREADRGLRQRPVRLSGRRRTMPEIARAEYLEELATLEASALGGLDLVNIALGRTMEAVEHQDVELAQVVIADDDRIDGRYLEVHQSLITLLATQSPVATDLRLISALLHVLKSIERMGDQCVNVCKVIPLTGNDAPADARDGRADPARWAPTPGALIVQAKRAFEERDVEMARDLVRRDDVVDELNRECFHLALEIGDDADTREWAMTMLLAARAIERIGDNAVDIGEQVAFVVTGLFREFEDASHPAAVALERSVEIRCAWEHAGDALMTALRGDRYRFQHDAPSGGGACGWAVEEGDGAAGLYADREGGGREGADLAGESRGSGGGRRHSGAAGAGARRRGDPRRRDRRGARGA